jgi:hypothetical protein
MLFWLSVQKQVRIYETARNIIHKGKPYVGFLCIGFDYVGKAHANNNRRNNKR